MIFFHSLRQKMLPVFFSACLFLAHQAYAQRGQGYGSSEAIPSNPMHGFPNFLDPNVLPKGDFYTEFPTFSFDYGLSERTTIGTNVLTTVALLQGTPVILAKARYRILSTENANTAVTGYMGYLMGQSISEGGSVLLATTNTSWYFSNMNWMTFSGIFTHIDFTLNPESSDEYLNLNLSSAMVVLGYSHFLTSGLGIESHLFVPVITSLFLDTPDASLGVSALGGKSSLNLIFARLLIDMIPSPSWLISAGGLLATDNTQYSLSPLVFVGYKW